jgi:subtilase family serine protease
MLVLVLASFGLPSPSAQAAGNTPGTATPISSLPFDSLEYIDVQNPAPTPASPQVTAVSSRCNAGKAIYRPRWFTYKPAVTTSIVARSQADQVLGRDHYAARQGVAVLKAGTTQVLDCSVTSSEANTGAVSVPAGTSVLIVQFVVEDPTCSDFCFYENYQDLRVIPARSYVANDDWTNARVITSLPFTQTVDLTMASRQPQDGVSTPANCVSTQYYHTAIRTIWWTFTPTTTGPLTIAVNGIPLADSPTSPAPSVAKLTASGPEFVPDCVTPYPPVFQAGTTYLIEVGHLLETYEINRIAAGGPATLSISGGITLRKGPDLVVTDVSWSPTSPVAGSPVRFRATIKNQGSAPTQGGVTHGVLFKVDGTSVSFADSWNASLAPGASVTLTANGGPAGETWAAKAGTHTVEAKVDDLNRLPGEASETNNSRTRSMTVGAAAGKADLVVTSVSSSPVSPAVGAPVRFSAVVKNQGTAATPGGVAHRVLFKVDGVNKTWSDTRTASLAAGASVTLTANAGGTAGAWPATSGPHTVQAVVDDLAKIAEQNDANNTKDLQVTVGTAINRPDLVITSLTWSPSALAATKAVRFTATVKNQGTLTTPDVVHGVVFRINGTAVAFSDTSKTPLHPGESTTLTANGGPAGGTWTATSGTRTLQAQVDDLNRIPGEANEGNNIVNRVLLVP